MKLWIAILIFCVCGFAHSSTGNYRISTNDELILLTRFLSAQAETTFSNGSQQQIVSIQIDQSPEAQNRGGLGIWWVRISEFHNGKAFLCRYGYAGIGNGPVSKGETIEKVSGPFCSRDSRSAPEAQIPYRPTFKERM
jgi:hypothetical protein